jgi:putative transposase
MAELCREHDIADSLLRKWREQFLAAGAERLQSKSERTEADELRRQISRLERALGRKTIGGRSRGGTLAGMGVRQRVARSRELVAQGRPAAMVARVAGISRQAIYRRPARPPAGQRRALDAVDRAVLEVARANPTDGSRMVAAITAGAVSEGRRKRPGYFQVTRPDELWHMDMTSVWVAEHGWVYLNAIIDCCTREITGWAIDVRCRATEALTVVDQAIAARGVGSRTLTLGTDNGTAYTSKAFRARLSELEITHRRGGYRDPESQAFIESWFSKLKLRCVWREEFETLDEARQKINTYINSYHHRPHSGLGYKTPAAIAATWKITTTS